MTGFGPGLKVENPKKHMESVKWCLQELAFLVWYVNEINLVEMKFGASKFVLLARKSWQGWGQSLPFLGT